MRRLLAVAGACIGFCALAAPAAQAARVVETADSGSTHGELSYDKRKTSFGGYTYKNISIRIARGGTQLVDQAPPRRCAEGCGPANSYNRPNSIHVRDLDRDGEPEVVVDLYTGGAHCCFLAVTYSFNPASGSYRRTTRQFNRSYRLGDIGRDGLVEFRAVDGRFDYVFDCYACSRGPIQIWRLQDARFRDVTRKFPRLIKRDGRTLYRLYRRHPRFSPGLLASYVADQCLLRHCTRGFRAVRRADRRGWLGKDGKGYTRKLKRFLKRTGYR